MEKESGWLTVADGSTVIYSRRLIYRRWREEDAEALFLCARDPEVAYPSGWLPHRDTAYSRAVIRTVFMKRGSMAIVERDGDGAPIGSISLEPGPNAARHIGESEAEIGYWIGKDNWNKGYATEALDMMCRYALEERGMRRLWCAYHDGNERSRHVMEKCGFVYDHTDGDSYNPMLEKHLRVHFMTRR